MTYGICLLQICPCNRLSSGSTALIFSYSFFLLYIMTRTTDSPIIWMKSVGFLHFQRDKTISSEVCCHISKAAFALKRTPLYCVSGLPLHSFTLAAYGAFCITYVKAYTPRVFPAFLGDQNRFPS